MNCRSCARLSAVRPSSRRNRTRYFTLRLGVGSQLLTGAGDYRCTWAGKRMCFPAQSFGCSRGSRYSMFRTEFLVAYRFRCTAQFGTVGWFERCSNRRPLRGGALEIECDGSSCGLAPPFARGSLLSTSKCVQKGSIYQGYVERVPLIGGTNRPFGYRYFCAI